MLFTLLTLSRFSWAEDPAAMPAVAPTVPGTPTFASPSPPPSAPPTTTESADVLNKQTEELLGAPTNSPPTSVPGATSAPAPSNAPPPPPAQANRGDMPANISTLFEEPQTVAAPPSTSPDRAPIPQTAPLTGSVPPAAPLTAPVPAPNNVLPVASTTTASPPLSQSEIDQFQNWLKSNSQQQPPQQRLVPPPPPKVVTRHVSKPAKKRKQCRLVAMPQGPDAPLVESPPMTFQESRQIMLDSAPPSKPPSPEASEAFNAMMQQNMPLTPQQVVKLRQLIDSSQRAAAIPANVPPKPVSGTIMINLAPGATPPAVRLAQGYVSSLVFVDSAGSPWPIAAYDIGDPKATTIQWDNKSNILLIQALSPYSDGNLVVRLVGLPTPITLEIVSGQRVVDFRTDIHVPGIGPNTKDLPVGTQLPNSASQVLLSVLDGIAPPGSKQLTVKGGDCQAWLLGDKMYLRTRMTVLSPGWVGKMVSPDGMIAYETQRTSSVLVSQYGNPIELKIEGF